MGQVFARDDQVLGPIVLAADDDVGMRMAGVVVIDGDPIEPRAEILLHLAHEPAGEILEVVVLDRVLGGDDEAELVPVAVASLEEGPAVRLVQLRVVEVAGQALAGDAVALEIAEMDLRALQPSARKLDDAALTTTRRARKAA